MAVPGGVPSWTGVARVTVGGRALAATTMNHCHDVLSADYWAIHARRMRDLTASAPDDATRAVYVRLIDMYDRLANLTRSQDGPHGVPRLSIPLLARRPENADRP